tara:strand:- start:26 stop:319 length:294 start_codon:yes stop_codon:yes gene_type:complete
MSNGTWEGRNLDMNKERAGLVNLLNRNYKSPESEESFWKGLPMSLLPAMKKHFRGEFVYRPRGGTYTSYRHNCTMVDATSFAVYSLMPMTHKEQGLA